jgi:hypothetical protein
MRTPEAHNVASDTPTSTPAAALVAYLLTRLVARRV